FVNAPAAVIVSKPLVMASIAAAKVLLVEVRRLVEANPFPAVIVSSPLVTDGVANPLVMDALTKPLVNVLAALIVSRPLVTDSVASPLVTASVAAASVLLVL